MSRDSLLLFCLNAHVLQFKTPWNVESKALLKPDVKGSLLSLLFTGFLILSEELGWPAMAHSLTINFSITQSCIIILEAMLWNIHTVLGSIQVKVNQVSVKWLYIIVFNKKYPYSNVSAHITSTISSAIRTLGPPPLNVFWDLSNTLPLYHLSN